MATNKKGVKKASKPGIYVDVTVGILHTVAKAIYASLSGKIREAVANAQDNKATWVVILPDRLMNKLIIFDNGHGITEDRFKEIFKSIGFGMLKESGETKLSYFGLGLMSVFQLGKKIKLFTKPKGQDTIQLLEVNTESIFDPANEKVSISTLGNLIDLKKSDETTRETSSPLPLEDFIKKKLGGKPHSFTEIIIDEVSDEDIDKICKPEFLEELCKILPLRVDKDEPFITRFVGNESDGIREILKNKKYCPTIDFYFGIQVETKVEEEVNSDEEEEKYSEFKQLFKYFPKFRRDLVFPDSNVLYGYSENKDFAYYVAHTEAVDLYRETEKQPEIRENGLWIRNQNFLVKPPDFLEKTGPGRPIISMPVRGWIFGEIFHKNMNRFLSVSRTEYLFDHKDFLSFRLDVLNIVKPLDKDLRTIWKHQKKITQDVIKPFEEISKPGGTFKRTEDRLLKLKPEDKEYREFKELIFDRFREKRNAELEGSKTIESVLADVKAPIPLGEKDDLIVQLDPNIKAVAHQVSWDKDQEKVTISLSPTIFSDKTLVFLDETFELLYVVNSEENNGISVDVDNKKIYINPFNKDLCRYSVTILDVLVAMEFAYTISNDMDELKKNFLSLMEIEQTDAFGYIRPLGDDLRRRVKLGS